MKGMLFLYLFLGLSTHSLCGMMKRLPPPITTSPAKATGASAASDSVSPKVVLTVCDIPFNMAFQNGSPATSASGAATTQQPLSPLWGDEMPRRIETETPRSPAGQQANHELEALVAEIKTAMETPAIATSTHHLLNAEIVLTGEQLTHQKIDVILYRAVDELIERGKYTSTYPQEYELCIKVLRIAHLLYIDVLHEKLRMLTQVAPTSSSEKYREQAKNTAQETTEQIVSENALFNLLIDNTKAFLEIMCQDLPPESDDLYAQLLEAYPA